MSKPKYSGQNVDFSVHMTDTGRWVIDDILGKQLIIIRLHDTRTDRKLDYCPTYDDLYELIQQMMEAEYCNDRFRFINPVRREYGPPEFERKLRALEVVLQEFRSWLTPLSELI